MAAGLVLGTLFLGATDARAKETSAMSKDPFATEVYPPQETRRDFSLMGITPLDNKALYFELMVPKNWRSVPFTVPGEVLEHDGEQLVPIGRVAASDKDYRVVIEVLYIRAPAETTPEQVLQAYAEASGFRILKKQKGSFNGRAVFEYFFERYAEHLEPVWSRVTASRRGDRIFVVSCSAPVKDWDKWRRTFATAVVSFDPKGESRSP
jgi:hypothetical protein